MLSTLISQVDRKSFKTPYGWFQKIEPFYTNFVKQIWTSPEAQEVLFKMTKTEKRRCYVLFKYWALNNVTTLDEARKTIHVCQYCGKELCMPASVIPNDNRPWIVPCCYHRSCQNKYVDDKTKESVFKTYGVNNVNDIEGMKERKSQLLIKANIERGNEIKETRRATVNALYGVDNVSQIEHVQKLKEDTCKEHYGVTNPDWASEINIKRSCNTLMSKSFKCLIQGKEFPVLDKSEKEMIQELSRILPVDIIESNQTTLERMINGKSRCNIVDVSINGQFFIELKSNKTFSYSMSNEDYISDRLKIVVPLLEDNQRYIFYVRNEKHRHVLIVDNQYNAKIRTSDPDIKDCIKCFGSYRCYNTNDKLFNIRYMDLSLAGAFYRSIYGKTFNQK